jgi:hypothetical protein
MPPNTNDINFEQIYQRDMYKILKTCNCHFCNPACYKNNKDVRNKLCRYGFPHKIMNDTHFDFLMMKQNYYILNKLING